MILSHIGQTGTLALAILAVAILFYPALVLGTVVGYGAGRRAAA